VQGFTKGFLGYRKNLVKIIKRDYKENIKNKVLLDFRRSMKRPNKVLQPD
jgi:hypothetical protein